MLLCMIAKIAAWLILAPSPEVPKPRMRPKKGESLSNLAICKTLPGGAYRDRAEAPNQCQGGAH